MTVCNKPHFADDKNRNLADRMCTQYQTRMRFVQIWDVGHAIIGSSMSTQWNNWNKVPESLEMLLPVYQQAEVTERQKHMKSISDEHWISKYTKSTMHRCPVLIAVWTISQIFAVNKKCAAPTQEAW